MTDTIGNLRALVDRGYQFLHPRDTTGVVEEIIGFRVHHHVIDLVRMHDESDACAFRMPDTEPNLLAPKTEFWRISGMACEVVDALLALPDPDAAEPERPHAADRRDLDYSL
jgi:NAD-dependent oxidoreductase involved in siderophore biosynthesis